VAGPVVMDCWHSVKDLAKERLQRFMTLDETSESSFKNIMATR
jgi:hypothetical protein